MSSPIQIFHSPPEVNGFQGKTPSKKNSPAQMNQKHLFQKGVPLILLFLLFISGAAYFLSSYSDVGTLSVEGSNEVLDQQVIDQSSVRSGDSLWNTYLNREQIEEQIVSALPQVADVSLIFSGLNDFTFEIEEYHTVAYIAEEEGYHKVLENGKVLEDQYATSIGNQPVFINFEEGDALDRIINQFDELDENIQRLISEIEHVESDRNPLLVRAYMNNGNQVLASIPSFADRMNYYPQMVEAVDGQHGLFDLEAGAFFTPFRNNDPETEELDEESEVEINGVED